VGVNTELVLTGVVESRVVELKVVESEVGGNLFLSLTD